LVFHKPSAKPRRSPLNEVRLLIIRPGALGDTLLLAPALFQLVGRAEVTLLGRKPGIDLLRPLVSRCLDYEKGGWHMLFSDEPECHKLPLPKLDRVVSFLTDSSGIAHRTLEICLKHTPIFPFRPFPPRRERIHVASYLASCLKESGLPVDPEEAMEAARKKGLLEKDAQSGSKSMVVFHPGSGSRRKNEPPEFWTQLIGEKELRGFQKRVLLLGPAEEQLRELFLRHLARMEVEIVASPDVEMLVSLLRDATVFIGHDSGITHLAALLGVTTIAIFRGSNPIQWAPLGPRVTVIAGSKSQRGIYGEIRQRVKEIREFCLD
jgi:heptosyltransferase-3